MKLGVDLIKPLSVEEWTALNADFAVVRVINEDGTIDGTGIRNLRAALEANMTELSGLASNTDIYKKSPFGA